MEQQELLTAIKERMPVKRYLHTIGVMHAAIELAERFGEDPKKAEIAAILHDVAKFADKDWMKKKIIKKEMDPTLLEFHHELWHAPVGAHIAKKEFGVKDKDILNAISYHTTGRAGMSNLEKIIYVADMIEQGRTFSGVEQLREQAKIDLDLVMKDAITHSIKFLIGKNQPVFPDSFECYNDMMLRERKSERMTPTLLEIAYKAADDKRAEDIVVLNMKGISLLADYFVICHGNSDRQVQAIAKEMTEQANKEGHEVKRLEGFDAARWILVDMGDVVAHIFHKDERAYYNLERLWGDASHEEITLSEQ